MQRISPRRSAAVIGSLAATLAATLAAGATAAGSPSVHAASKEPFTLAPETIVADAATVKRDLAGVSADGHTYRFRRLDGPLTKLHVGSVLILNHATLDRVTKVTHSGGSIIAATVPASIGEAFTSAHIDIHGAPEWGRTIVQKIGGMAPAAAARVQRPPAYLTSDRASAADASTSHVVAGNVGSFGYNLTFDPVPGRINISGTLCYQAGAICNNGLASEGLAMEASFKGYVDASDAEAIVDVNRGHPIDTAMKLAQTKIHYSITWGVGRGTGGEGQPDPPALHIPVGVDIPISLASGLPLPMFIRIQLGMYIKLGVTSHNATYQGTINGDTDADAEQLRAEGHHLSADVTGATTQAEITPKTSLSPAAGGIVLAFQIPKLGAGLGISDVNGLAYMENIASVGQLDGSAFGGQLCSDYDLFDQIKAGIDEQFFGALVNTSKVLKEKHFKLHQC